MRLARLRANHGLSGRGHPVGERRPRVALRPPPSAAGTARAWARLVSPVRGLRASRRAAREQHLVARAAADGDRREERGHAVVIGLAPAVERMVVALGAGDAHAEEDLRQRAGRLARLGDRLVKGWPARPRSAVPRPSRSRARTGRTACSAPGCRAPTCNSRRPACVPAPADRRAAGRPISAPSSRRTPAGPAVHRPAGRGGRGACPPGSAGLRPTVGSVPMTSR